MPLFLTSLRFAHDATWPQRRKWSNTFWVNGSSPVDTAAAVASAWFADLRPAAHPTIFAYEVYSHDATPGTDNFTTVSIPEPNQRGTMPMPGDPEEYLAKACVRVPLRPLTGRPSFKFWRPGLYEGEVIEGVGLAPALTDAISAAFSAFIEDMEGLLFDPDAQALIAVGSQRLTTREFGRYAGNDLPDPPPVA